MRMTNDNAQKTNKKEIKIEKSQKKKTKKNKKMLFKCCIY